MSSRSRHDHKRHTHADGTPRTCLPGTNNVPLRRRVYAFTKPCLDDTGKPKDSPERHIHPRRLRTAEEVSRV